MTHTIKCALFLAIAAVCTVGLFTGYALAVVVWLIERVLG